MARILVVGAGIAGLGAGLLLGRAGHDVTILERDATPFPADPAEAFETWDRHGAPQVRHSHAFLARLRNLLRDRLPDVLDMLVDCGAEELTIANLLREGIDDRSAQPGDDDLSLLACRRLTFEWVLHRVTADEATVTLRDGARVTGLDVSTEGEVPVVRGVRLEDGETLAADLVVDAAGRRSRLGSWLVEAGLPALRDESEPCGIFYCSRFYRLRDDATPPERDTTIGADLGFMKYAIFHGDSKIFSITFAAAPEDRPLRALLHEGPFTAAAEALPATRSWIDPAIAEPISDVHAMDALRNTRRFFIEDGVPIATGLVAIGDAAVHTNPLYGRGCSFALVHAALLADRLATHGDDLLALAKGLDEDVEREIIPWYEMARTQDREAASVAAALRAGEPPASHADDGGVVDPRAYMRDVLQKGLIPALRLDATVLRAFLRAFNLLDPPGDLLTRPDLLQRVLAVYQTRHERTEPELGPDRDALIEILAAA